LNLIEKLTLQYAFLFIEYEKTSRIEVRILPREVQVVMYTNVQAVHPPHISASILYPLGVKRSISPFAFTNPTPPFEVS